MIFKNGTEGLSQYTQNLRNISNTKQNTDNGIVILDAYYVLYEDGMKVATDSREVKDRIHITGFEASLEGPQIVRIFKMPKVDIEDWRKEELKKNECGAPTDKDSIRTE